MGTWHITETLRGDAWHFFIVMPRSHATPSQEVKPGMVELMKLAYTLAQSEIQDGDIICFQAEISDAEIRQLEAQGMYSNPLQFYDYLYDRVMVLFKPKFDDPEVDQPEFSLVLSRKQNYGAVSHGLFIDLTLLDISDLYSPDGLRSRGTPQARADKTKIYYHSRF